MNKRALIWLSTFCILTAVLPSTTSPAAAALEPAVESMTPGSINAAPCRSWRNPKVKRLRFALLCIHGLGLNSRSYTNFAQRMAAVGAIVYAIDVRGFGAWMQAQGHQEINFDDCLKDIKVALETIQRANPTLPVFILGESMGGAIALRAAALYPNLVDGVISAVPAGDRFKQKRTDLKVALAVLEGIARPQKATHMDVAIGKSVVEQGTTIRENGKEEAVNEKMKQAWEGDIFDRLNVSPRELIQFQRFMNENYDCVKKIQDPVLFVLGLNDDLVKPDGTWELAKACAVSDRSVVALPAPHLLFEEAQTTDAKTIEEAVRFVFAWIDLHVPDHVAVEAQKQSIPASLAAQITQGLPTVLVFYARWCNQCETIAKYIVAAQKRTGSNVRYKQIDVDVPANAELIKQFGVGALPQIFFLKPDGSITSTVVGETTGVMFAENLVQLIRDVRADQNPQPPQAGNAGTSSADGAAFPKNSP